MTKTYEVRTYGCQMNVHDSERLSGLLEDAGYVAAPRRASRPTWSCSTRAPSARTPTTSSTATSATSRRSRRRSPACRSPSAAAWRRRTAARSPASAPRGSTSSSAPTTSARCRPCSSARASARRRRSRSSSRSRSSRRRCRPSASRRTPPGSRSRVGCNNTCTFCIVPSLRGKEKDRRPGDVLAEIRGARRRGRHRGHAARPERQLVRRRVRRPARVRQAAARLRRDRGTRARALHRPHPADFTDDVIAAMAETPNVMPQLHMPLQSGSDRDAQGDAPVVPPGRSTSASSTAYARRCLTPRSRTDIIVGFPGETEEDFLQTHGGRARRRGSPAPSRSSTPSAPAPRPPCSTTRCRRRSCRSATSGSSRWSTTSPGTRTRQLVGRAVELLVAEGEGRKDAATHRLTGRARDNRLVHFAPGTTPYARATWSTSHHLRRAAPPGERRAPHRTAHAGRRRLGGAPGQPKREASASGCPPSACRRCCRQSTPARSDPPRGDRRGPHLRWQASPPHRSGGIP